MPTDSLVHDLQNGQSLLNLLGSFWNQLYGGKKLVGDILTARSQAERQTFRDLLELIACTSRFYVPIYHRKNWKMLTVKESEITTTPYGVTNVSYGDAMTDLIDCKLVMNRIVSPSVLYTQHIDYIIGEGTFRFNENPFENPLFPQRVLYTPTGEIEDTEIDLWLFNGDFDWELVYEQFGYVLDIYLRSGQNYLDVLNVIFDALQLGTSQQHMSFLMSAIADVPVVIEATETVEAIFNNRDNLVVATDQHLYKFHPDSIAVVEVGQVLKAGDQLTDTVEFIEFTNGTYPDSLSFVSMSEGFLAKTYASSFKWYDTDVATVVTENVSGKTKITWPLGGDSGEVTTFWSDVHTLGVADGTTLANLLDQRTNQVGEPTAANLPTTINPLQWLVENVLRYNTFVCIVKADLLGANTLELDNVPALFRKVVCPHTAMMLQTVYHYSASHSVDALLLQTVFIAGHTVDALIVEQHTLSHGTDAVLL